jgi:hypothetical protein
LRSGIVVAVSLLGLACAVPEEAPVPEEGPSALRIRGPEALDDELVSAVRVDRTLALAQHATLLSEGSQLSRQHADGTVEDLGSEPGPLTAAARFGDVAVLAGTRGVFTLDTLGLRRSPIDEALVDHTVHAMVEGGDSLWLATDGGLLRWHGGVLTAVEPEGLPLTDAVISAASLDEGEGVWVASAETLFAVYDAGDGLQARVEADRQPHAMATDAAGSLWCADGDRLLRRQPDGSWDEWIPPSRVQALASRPDRNEVWITLEDSVAVFDASDFRGVEPTPEGEIVDVDSLGRALIVDRDVRRLSLDRPMAMTGAPAGVLEEPMEISFFPTRPDRVEGLDVLLDGGDSMTLSEPFTLALDPLDFEEGPHRLDMAVRYDDREEPVNSSLSFGVGAFEVPTWTSGIEPLHRGACAECHDPGGSARLLATSAQWQADVDLVLDNVTDQLMPLPPNDPLTVVQIQAIQAWAAGGFPE